MSTPEEPTLFETGQHLIAEVEDAVLDALGIEHIDHVHPHSEVVPEAKAGHHAAKEVPEESYLVSFLETAVTISDAANDAVETFVDAYFPHEEVSKEQKKKPETKTNNTASESKGKESSAVETVSAAIQDTAQNVKELASEAVKSTQEALAPKEKSTMEVVSESVTNAVDQVCETTSAAVESAQDAVAPKTTSEVIVQHVVDAAAVVDKAGNDLVEAVADAIAEIDKPKVVPPHKKSAFDICAEQINEGAPDVVRGPDSAKEPPFPAPPHVQSDFDRCIEPLHFRK